MSVTVIIFISELLVTVSDSYNPPPGVVLGPNEYRAASGPVTVTCSAIGGTEGVSYQWSSTCRNCPFQTATSRWITRPAVRSGDSGTHTCTATSAGITGNTSINITVKGIYTVKASLQYKIARTVIMGFKNTYFE